MSGCLLLLFLGRDRFYILAQKSGLAAQLCRDFATDAPVGKVVDGFREIERDHDQARQSAASVEIYSDDSLGGFGDSEFTWTGDSHNSLTDQLRCVILGRLREQIEALGAGAKIVEIGTGNGDVLALLATEYPDREFVGVDFSVRNANEKHGAVVGNLRFQSGYALDLLERGELRGDLVFGSSTWVVLGPAELGTYLPMLKKAGFKRIVVSEPLTRRYDPRRHPEPASIHMARGMWGHNYPAYFQGAGFRVAADDRVVYTKHKVRPEITMQVVVATV